MTTKKSRITQLKGILTLQSKRSRLLNQLATLDQQIADKLEREVSNLASASTEARSAAPRPALVVAKGSKGKAAAKAAPRVETRGRRGALKEQILAQLEKAGAKGIQVQELAKNLNTKPANIHTWFSTNSGRIAGLAKVAAGRYALTGKEAPKAKIAKTTKAAKPAKAPKAVKAAKAAPKAAVKAAAKTKAKAPAKAASKATSKAAPKAPKAAAPKKVAATRKAKTPAKAAASSKSGDDFVPAKRGELKTSVLAELKKAGAAGISIKDLADKVGTRYKNLYIWFVTTGKRIPGIEKVAPAQYRYSG